MSLPRSQFHRRGRGSRILATHVVQHRPFLQRIMVWSCFSHTGPGPLVVVNGTMNAQKYKDTLMLHMLPKFETWFPGGDGIYQHDNAPCHKAKLVKQFFEQRAITTIDWPPYSPDLSPIENLWAIVKMKVHRESFLTKTQLAHRLQEIWHSDENIPLHCSTLIEKMPDRIHACIRARGGPIDY